MKCFLKEPAMDNNIIYMAFVIILIETKSRNCHISDNTFKPRVYFFNI